MERTPDEIKKGLNDPIHVHYHHGDREPHLTPLAMCDLERLHANTLALIYQLEAKNAEKDDRIRQLEAERDALMHYLHSMGCDTCLYDDYDGSEPPCINCTATRDLWQFQGVQKEDRP